MGWTDARLERHARAVLVDPIRRALTLQAFAKTETEGADDLARAARLTGDPELRGDLERHAEDERRHGALFADLAAEARAQLPREAFTDAPDLRPFAPLAVAEGRDAHGFLPADAVESEGELAYVAMLFVAETRAERLFGVLRRAWGDDAALAAALDTAIRDERRHVGYTRRYLDLARKAGRGREVKRALAAARGARFGGALARFAARTAERVAKALLAVFYFVVVPVFALAAKAGGDRRPAAVRRAARDRLAEPY